MKKDRNYSEKILKQAFAFPDSDEMKVAMVLVDKLDCDVLFLAPNLTENARTPDVRIDGIEEWEIKTPSGTGKYNLQHAFKAALKQSENVIFYLEKWKLPQKKAIAKLGKIFDDSRNAKKMIIITKQERILEFSKKQKKKLTRKR